MKRTLIRTFTIASVLLAVTSSGWAQTDGTVAFSVRTERTYQSYDPKNIMAIWVTDGNGNFIKTLKKQAASRETYLYTWKTNANYNVVDAITGATLSDHQTHNVTWNCTDTSGALVPDGDYRIRVEYTTRNGSGPITPVDYLRFTKDSSSFTSNFADLAQFTSLSASYTVRTAEPIAIPGRLEAEDYLGGGEGVGYHDTTAGNSGGATYRSDDVDIENCSEGGYDIAWIAVGEWLKYEVNIAEPRTYELRARVATEHTDDKSFHVEIDGTNVSGAITFNTGGAGWQSWQDTAAYSVDLPAGNHELRIVFDADNFNLNYLDIVPPPFHDVAVSSLSGPVFAPPSSSVSIETVVSNRGSFAETFNLSLYDTTDNALIGSREVSSLAAGSASNVTFSWNTESASGQYHELEGIASAVTAETDLLNNTNTLTIPVATGLETNVIVAAGSVWRYNDKGQDIHSSTWRLTPYYDLFWDAGPAQLGYAEGDEATTNSYGSNSSDKYPCYYYRHRFTVDFAPLSLQANVLRDDGVVVYLNGLEILRDNMPSGDIGYTNRAVSTVGGGDEDIFYPFTVDESIVEIGENALAVEIHQATADSSDISFDLELLGVTPIFPKIRDLAVLGVEVSGDGVVGDTLDVKVIARNDGNTTEGFTVTLTDTNDAVVIGTKQVSQLLPQTWTEMEFEWPTLSASLGEHTLEAAITPVSGETNLLNNTGQGSASISSAGFVLNASSATGSIGGFCGAIAVDGNRAYLGKGSTLSVLDISSPASPVELGNIRLPGKILSVAVSGSRVCTANGNAGVHIIDVSTPAAPRHRNTFDTSGHAAGVAADGNTLYAACGGAGLRILDITDPDAPSLLGSFVTEGPARAVSVNGSTVYVLDQYGGFLVLNAASPASASLVGEVRSLRFGEAILLSGSSAYVVDGGGLFSVVDVSTPASPTVTGSVRLSAPGAALTSDGSMVYAAVGSAGLAVINPATPAVVTTLDTPGEASGAAYVSSKVLVADGFSGMQVVDVSSPPSPSIDTGFTEGLRGSDTVVQDGVAYVAAGEAGLRIYSVTNPASPELLGSSASALNARRVAVDGSTALIADSQYGLRIMDVSNPASILLLKTYTNNSLGSVRSAAMAGNLAVITDGHRIELLDITTPSAPVFRDAYETTGYAFDLAVTGTRVVVAAGARGLLILSVANPSQLSYLGEYNTPGMAQGVVVSGDEVQVADGSGWLTIDISNPGSPSLVGSSSAQGPVFDVARSAHLVHLGDAGAGVSVLDISTPLTPVPKTSLDTLTHAMRLAAEGPYVYVAEGDAGLALFNVSPDDTDVDRLPDSWEQQIVDADGGDAITKVEDVLPGDDFDHDGHSNYEELLAGTDATDPDSIFSVAAIAPEVGSDYVVQWYSIAGKRYTIHKSTNLMNGFTVLQSGIDATAPINAYTDTVDSAEAVFYMISTQE